MIRVAVPVLPKLFIYPYCLAAEITWGFVFLAPHSGAVVTVLLPERVPDHACGVHSSRDSLGRVLGFPPPNAV